MNTTMARVARASLDHLDVDGDDRDGHAGQKDVGATTVLNPRSSDWGPSPHVSETYSTTAVLKSALESEPQTYKKTKSEACCQVAVAVFVLLPMLCFVIAALGALAIYDAEGWEWEETFWMLLGELLGTTIPLEQSEASLGPTTRIGRFAWAWASMASLGLLGMVVALMSGPLLEPFEVIMAGPPLSVQFFRWLKERRARDAAAAAAAASNNGRQRGVVRPASAAEAHEPCLLKASRT